MLDGVHGARISPQEADQAHLIAAGPAAPARPVSPSAAPAPATDDAAPVVVRDRTSRIVWWLAARAPLVTAVLASAVALIGFRGGDYPAQDYRAFMFGAHGFLIWDVNWYGGHAALGYDG